MRPSPIILCLLGALLAPRLALPCAIAPPEGSEVAIEHEDALIVWDPDKGVEHFIRRARFDTTAKDFGFLVPTPSKPELAEVPEALFDRLTEAIKPEVKERTGFTVEPVSLFFCMTLRSADMDGMAPTLSAPAVKVLEQKQVGGLDAAVLEATETTPLLEWLQKNGYPHAPQLDGWLEPYVKAGWKITAFKIAGELPDSRVLEPVSIQSTLVRMSFPATKPFYPYREPQRARPELGGERSLRVWLVGPGRLDGTLGEDGRGWPGRVVYAAPRTDLAQLLADALPSDTAPPEGWLTAYVDASSPRRGTDEVFFQASMNLAPVLPPPVFVDRRTTIPLPLELFFLGFVAVGVILVRRRRNR
jgi:hypothetical protein